MRRGEEKTFEQIYDKLWELMGDLDNVKSELLYLAEDMKPLLKPEYFEPKKPPPPTEQE